MTDKTPSDIVAECVTGHAEADKFLARAYRSEQRTIDAIEDGLELGMIADGMAAKQFIWGHRQALGIIAAAGKALADLHPLGTAFAQANGVDLGKISEAGGVKLPVPEVSTKDTGR